MDGPELVLVGHEAPGKETERILEESVIVFSFEHGGLHIADQVLEERSDYDVDDLTNLQVNCVCKSST